MFSFPEINQKSCSPSLGGPSGNFSVGLSLIGKVARIKAREFAQNQLTPEISSQTGCTELKVNQPVRQLIPSESKGPPDKMRILTDGLTFSVEKVGIALQDRLAEGEFENRARLPWYRRGVQAFPTLRLAWGFWSPVRMKAVAKMTEFVD